jgi:hypothetical protein
MTINLFNYKAIFVGIFLLMSFPHSYAQSPINPIGGAVSGLGLIADILSGKTLAKYNPLDNETFGNLASDLIAIGAQKNVPVLPEDIAGKIAITVGLDRSELAHYSTWRSATGIDEESLFAPSIGIHYGVLSKSYASFTFKQFRSDGAQLIGLSFHHDLSTPASPMSVLLGGSRSQLLNGAPLHIQTTSADMTLLGKHGKFKPYVGLGIIQGKAEFDYIEKMQFSTTIHRVFGGFVYRINQVLVGVELGSVGKQRYQGISATYLF